MKKIIIIVGLVTILALGIAIPSFAAPANPQPNLGTVVKMTVEANGSIASTILEVIQPEAAANDSNVGQWLKEFKQDAYVGEGGSIHLGNLIPGLAK